MRRRLRSQHYSLRTERAYLAWARRFLIANGRRDPHELGGEEVSAFLRELAVKGGIAASTQDLALAALRFLYRDVLGVEQPWIEEVARAIRAGRAPHVLARSEIERLLAAMQGRSWLVASLTYLTGLRPMECLRLRVGDLDFTRREITVRDGKGMVVRCVVLPARLESRLQREVHRIQALHEQDLALGFGTAYLRTGLAQGQGGASREFGAQYLFPAGRLSRDPRDGGMRRHHLEEAVLARALRQARAAAGIATPVGLHTLRHSFAAHREARGHPAACVRAPESLAVKEPPAYEHGGGAARERAPAQDRRAGVVLNPLD